MIGAELREEHLTFTVRVEFIEARYRDDDGHEYGVRVHLPKPGFEEIIKGRPFECLALERRRRRGAST